MPQQLLPALMIVGMVVGILLYRLPSWLFYRNATWLPEDEFLAAYPEKRWVTRSMYGLLPLGFAISVFVLASTDDMNRGVNWIFFFPLFFGCMGAVPAVPEMVAKTGIVIPTGHGAGEPVQYAVIPNAARAAAFRLALASLIVASFLGLR